MNELFIRDKIRNLNRVLNENEIERLKKDNQELQDFTIWLIGFLDADISKKGEGKLD